MLCARSRKESRGLHFTTDHPHKSDVVADTDLRRGMILEGEVSSEPGAGTADD